MDFRIQLLLILLVAADVLGESISVTCSPQTICALQESDVKLNCSYSPVTIKTVFWFSPKQKAKWRNEEHPEDLILDSDYAGRVSTENTSSSSNLIIKDLREKDSGEYHLLIITESGEKHLSSTAVNLTVTDLQVKQQETKGLRCTASCMLTSVQQRYFWYKDGQYEEKYNKNSNTHVLSTKEEGSYSCSVFGLNNLRSPPLCVSEKGCWSVTYRDRRVCALKGSSVELTPSYSYSRDHKVEKMFWHYLWLAKEPKDLTQLEQFAGRVNYIADKSYTLNMRDVKMEDSGIYYFRMYASTGTFSGKPGVVLNVTALQVRLSPSTASDGETVTLMCSSTCTLPNNPTYIWYKNTQPVTNKPTRDNKLYLKCGEDAGSYSCAVRGHEELQSPAHTLSEKCPKGPSNIWVIAVVVGAILILILILAAVWMWRRKSRSANHHKSMVQSGQGQDELHYSSIHFQNSCTQKESASSRHLQDTMERESVLYAAVKFSR